MPTGTIETNGPDTQARTIRKNRLKRLTRVAGVLYLAIFAIYPLATSVRSILVVPGDAATTAQNVAANLTLFRWGMAGEATIFLIEIVLAGILYVLLRPVSRSMSLAAAFARASEGVVMAAGNLFTSILTLVVVGGAGYLAAFQTEQLDALALLFQEANDFVVLTWGFFFALHLVLLGWLVYRSGFFPKIPGVLLVLAGIGYFAQSYGVIVAPGLTDVLSTVVLVLAVPGELVFALWLLIKGVDEEKWHERALEAAETQL
ncbi:MAG: DUF4386 domain-containing protein [Actinomycetota bacterium]|nr:DUF4386 domain-containing protein [Actinomycetota bacterium]